MKTQTDTPREINGYQITCAECGDIFEAEEECGDPTQEFCGEDCRNRAKEDRALRAAAPDLLASLEEAERVIRHAAQEAVGRVKKEIVGGWLHHANEARAAIEKAAG